MRSIKLGEQVHAWWWLPDYPEDRIPGMATFQRGKSGEVHALGRFKNLGNSFRMIRDSIPLIYGRDVWDRLWTLSNVTLFGTANMKHGNYVETTLQTDRIILGAHVPTDQPMISEMVFRPSGLKEWAGSDLGIQFEYDEERDIWVSEIPNGKWRDPIVAEIGDGTCLAIEYMHYPTLSRENRVPVEHSCKCRATFDKGASFEECFEIIKIFCDFISFATRITSGIDEYSAQIEGGEENTWIQVWGLNTALRHGSASREYGQSGRNYFTVQGLSQNPETIIASWYEGAKRYKMAYHLYFAVALRKKGTYMEHEFFTYVQSLEGFARKDNQTGKLMPKKEYRQIVDEKIRPLLNTIVEENITEAMCGHLYMANEKKLRELLSELLAKRGNKFLEKWLPDVNVKEWIKQVVMLRNDFAHVLDDPKSNFSIGEKGFWQTITALRLLVEAQLLEMIGFSNEKIDKILCDTYKVESRIAS